MKKIRKFLSVVISSLLVSNVSGIEIGSYNNMSAIQYNTSSEIAPNSNISNEEKERLLNKYGTSDTGKQQFEKAKAQLEVDGYTIMQDLTAVTGGYDNGSWIVGKTLENNFWIGMTVYPFNETGKFTMDVKSIEGLFETYEGLKEAGYEVSCSDLTSFYTYFSYGKSPYGYAQITGSSWKVSKDGAEMIVYPYDKNGNLQISAESVQSMFTNKNAFEKAKAQLEVDGYTIMQDLTAVTGGYDNGSWIVGKTLENNFWIGMTVYPFNETGKFTMDVKSIEGLFETYEGLKEAGYEVSCSDLTSFYTYFSYGKSPYGYAQITGSSWKVSKDGAEMIVYPYDKNGNLQISAESVQSMFTNKDAFEKAGYGVEITEQCWYVTKDGVRRDVWNVTEPSFNVTNVIKNCDAYVGLIKDGFKVNQNDQYSWKVSKDGAEMIVYPYDENGNFVFSINEFRKSFDLETQSQNDQKIQNTQNTQNTNTKVKNVILTIKNEITKVVKAIKEIPIVKKIISIFKR